MQRQCAPLGVLISKEEYEAGFIFLFLVSACKGSFLILVSVYIGCPFGDTRNIYPTSIEGLFLAKSGLGLYSVCLDLGLGVLRVCRQPP